MAGKFVISIDFEKYWGMRDFKSINSLKGRLDKVDSFIEQLLELFKKYEIHATWATVGFLFHENKEELLKYLPEKVPSYTNKMLSPYTYIDQNSLEPIEYHFARESIKKIKQTPNQEIASHTYSHYYCLEQGQTIEDFRSDLAMFNKVFQASSIIFPRNLVNKEYLEVLKEYQIFVYRGNEEHFIYQPIKNKKIKPFIRALRLIDRYISLTGNNTYKVKYEEEKVLNIPSSRLLSLYLPKLKLLEPLRLRRIKSGMTHAAKHGEVFHLWFHPHEMAESLDYNIELLEKILNHYKILNEKYNFDSSNMAEIASNK